MRWLAAQATELVVVFVVCGLVTGAGCGNGRASGNSSDASTDLSAGGGGAPGGSGGGNGGESRGGGGGNAATGGAPGAGGNVATGGAAAGGAPGAGGNVATGGAAVGGAPGAGGNVATGGAAAGGGPGAGGGSGAGGHVATGGGGGGGSRGSAGNGGAGGCVPKCENKQCGKDSCGGLCGQCQKGTTCISPQVCKPDCDFTITVVGRNGSRRDVSGSQVQLGSCVAAADAKTLLFFESSPATQGTFAGQVRWTETTPVPGSVYRINDPESQPVIVSTSISNPGAPIDLEGSYISTLAGADVTVRFVEIDPRVGGAYRVVIEPGSILANGGGDVVEVTGELFGKFSQ